MHEGDTVPITVNGQQMDFRSGMTVLALLEDKGLNPATVVVELNGRIIPGDAFAEAQINDDDTLEILGFVGGG